MNGNGRGGARAAKRFLIVNADDFGLSEGTNRGIIEAHERGIVTSASLMVRRPAAEETARYARQNSKLAVGLHLDLGEWTVGDDFAWNFTERIVDVRDAAAVRKEFLAQLARFRKLLGRDPTHLDSHQHAHRDQPARLILLRAAQRMRIPLRHFSRRVRYCGDFYGQAADGAPTPDRITAAALIEIIRDLKPGITELACHPGEDVNLASGYRLERQLEVSALTDPSVPAALRENGILLRSFATVPLGRPRDWIIRLQRLFSGQF
jgi:chitin disaccharide deacetylase